MATSATDLWIATVFTLWLLFAWATFFHWMQHFNHIQHNVYFRSVHATINPIPTPRLRPLVARVLR